jgi:peptidyl-prolyl cis-trans isomerase SurA
VITLGWMLAAGCGGGAYSTVSAVAHVGDAPVLREELDLYLALNLPAADEDGPFDPSETNRVKSRLLDALLDEKTLVMEAERRGLEVDGAEITAYLESYAADGGTAPEPMRDRYRHLVRQRLLIHKLEEATLERVAPPSDEEVRQFIAQSRGQLSPEQRLRLRALRFDSPDHAVQAAARIQSGRMSFADAVMTYESDPGQGVLLEFAWKSLPDDLHDALDGLEPGEVSRPVEFHDDTFLFQLDSWVTEPAEMERDLVRRARIELERQRRRSAGDRLLRQLRLRAPVRIHEKRLPFRYLPEPGA